ncbi:MAG TPA: hypothetical protein VNO26_13790 [Candidatus Limnocylindria bacterium]|nr:hypothetical protein [Candidatus Limnocylindria bacterium]
MHRALGLACMLAALAARPWSAAAEPVPSPDAAAPAPTPAPGTAAPSATPGTAAPPASTPAPAPSGGASSTGAPAAKPARLALVGRTREHLIYIDKPTLRKVAGDRFELWAEVHSDGGDRVKFLMQLNCGERSYLVKSEVVYDAEGKVIENDTFRSPSLQYVVPDSASEFIHEAICREAK